MVLGQTKLQSSRPVRMTVGNNVLKQRMKFYWNKQCPQCTEESHSRPNCCKEQLQFNSAAQKLHHHDPLGDADAAAALEQQTSLVPGCHTHSCYL